MLAFARLSACGKERRWRGKLFKASEGTSKLAGLLVAIVVRGRSPSFPRLLQTPSRFPGSSRTPAAKGGREGIRVGGVAEVGGVRRGFLSPLLYPRHLVLFRA